MTTQTDNEVQTTDDEIVENFNHSVDRDLDAADAKKMKAFVKFQEDSRGVNPLLTIAVIEQFGIESFLECAGDVYNHGITGGFSGFIYYTDTEPFYIDNRDLIIAWAKDFYESLGISDSLVGFIAGFGSMKSQGFSADDIGEFLYSNNADLDNFTYFANNMSWGVAEEICYGYTEFAGEYEDEDQDDDGYE